jgi:phosphatidylglycerophosphate synthase
VSVAVEAERARRSADRGAEVTVKGRDCWWTVLVVDPIAAPLVRVMSPVRRITPNALTAAGAAIAIVAAAAYAFDQLVVGAILFQASFVVDCTDGKLAHTRGTYSRYGSYLDAVADGVRFASCTGGLVFALASHTGMAAGWVTVLALFPTLHYVRLSTQAAWPRAPTTDSMVVRASVLAILRAAPGRLSKPGTTVDTEALAFTIGPLVGLPLEGILAAAAIDGARLAASLAVRVRQSIRSPTVASEGRGP